MQESIVGLKELRTNTEAYIAQVRKGKSFIVVRRSKPVFKISSPDDESMWETVIDFTGKKRQVPVYHLKGKAAKRLDKLVEEGLRDHREGKTRKIKSLADLD